MAFCTLSTSIFEMFQFFIILNSFDCAIFLLRYHVSACPPIYCLCRAVHITSVPLWAACHWCSETLYGIELLYPSLLSQQLPDIDIWILTHTSLNLAPVPLQATKDKRQSIQKRQRQRQKGGEGQNSRLSHLDHTDTHTFDVHEHNKNTVLCNIQWLIQAHPLHLQRLHQNGDIHYSARDN